MPKYWKTTIVFEVLTEGEKALPDDMGLEDIIEMTLTGHASGNVESLESEQVDRQTMAELLKHQQSDPGFLIEDWGEEDARNMFGPGGVIENGVKEDIRKWQNNDMWQAFERIRQAAEEE